MVVQDRERWKSPAGGANRRLGGSDALFRSLANSPRFSPSGGRILSSRSGSDSSPFAPQASTMEYHLLNDAPHGRLMNDRPRTLGQLRESGYRSVSVKQEMRRNLLRKLRERRRAVSRHCRDMTKRSSRRSSMRCCRSTTCCFWGCGGRARRGCCGCSPGYWTSRRRSSPAARSTTIRWRRCRSTPAISSPRKGTTRRSTGSAATSGITRNWRRPTSRSPI